MSTEEKSNVTEIINSIATELAKNELNFRETHTEDQTMLKRLSMKIDENRDTVERRINIIYKEIKDNSKGIELPRNLKSKVAEHISQQVFENGLTNGEQIDVGNGISSLILEQIMIESLGIEELETIENIPERLNGTIKDEVLDNISRNEASKEQDKLNNFYDLMKSNFGFNSYSTKDFYDVDLKNKYIEKNFQKSLESILERAKNGDNEAKYQILLFQNASLPFLYPENFKNMTCEHQLEYLEGMMMIADSNIPEMKKLFEEMAIKAEKDGYNFFKIDENGNKIPNIEKLQEEYKKRSFDKNIGFNIELGQKNIRYISSEKSVEFLSIEDYHEENKIQAQQNMLQDKLEKLRKLRESNFEKKEELLLIGYNELKELTKTNLDAALRNAEEVVNTNYTEGKTELPLFVLEALIEVNDGKIDFIQDEYTENIKLDLYKGLLKEMQKEGKINKELIGKMKEADLKLANLVAKEFGVKTIDEFEILPKKKQAQNDTSMQFEPDIKEKISDEKKISNIKNIINNMNNIKGINNTQKFITNHIRKKNKEDKNNFIQATLDVLEQIDKNEEFYTKESMDSRKELFSAILESDTITEDNITKMCDIDSKISKELLKEVLEKQNNGLLNTRMINIAMLLGKNVDSEKSIEEDYIFKADKVMTEGVSLFDKNEENKNVDDVEEVRM